MSAESGEAAPRWGETHCGACRSPLTAQGRRQWCDTEGTADVHAEMDDRLSYLQHLRRQRDEAQAELAVVREQLDAPDAMPAGVKYADYLRKLKVAEQELAIVREQRDKAEALANERGEALDKSERERAATRGVLEAVQRDYIDAVDTVRTVCRERQQAEDAADRAREHAAEQMRESRGTSWATLARQVGARAPVVLFGRTYVDRERAEAEGVPVDPARWAGADELANLRDGTVRVQPDLLEAERGMFVPIPAGHMLSVTVSPYDPTPDEDDGPRCRCDLYACPSCAENRAAAARK